MDGQKKLSKLPGYSAVHRFDKSIFFVVIGTAKKMYGLTSKRKKS